MADALLWRQITAKAYEGSHLKEIFKLSSREQDLMDKFARASVALAIEAGIVVSPVEGLSFAEDRGNEVGVYLGAVYTRMIAAGMSEEHAFHIAQHALAVGYRG